jgi:hypothetical protein
MISEEQRIALGFRPRTLRGWWFWFRYWSATAFWWRGRHRFGQPTYRPDYNGECLNCDEWFDAHEPEPPYYCKSEERA